MATTEPLPLTVTTAVDPNEFGATPANDDNSYDAAEAARLSNYSTPVTVTDPKIQTDTINYAFSGTTQSGTPTSTTGFGNNKPGKRVDNPLGNFSSYTYQLSLYMITPDAYNAFVSTGRKNINALVNSGAGGGGGAFLIAQSGGINNTTSKRAPGFELDYYIDDLKMNSKVNGAATSTESNVVSFSFNIYEPYGFSFLTKLKQAQDELAKLSSLPDVAEQTNPTRNLFILGIRFQGYDKDGNIADSSQYFSQDTMNTGADRSGVYERFYDIIIETFKFKLNGSATTYSVTARPASIYVGLSVIRGMVDIQVPITAGTVEEALIGSGDGVTSLFGTLNAHQKELYDNGDIKIPMQYDVKFLGNADITIGSAGLVSDADKDKRKLPMSRASTSSQVNDSTSSKAVADLSKRLITITNDTPIPQAIKKIIQQSDYLERALKVIQQSELEEEENTDITEKTPPNFRWYNLSTQLECLGFDTKVGDYAYKITYVIQPYEAPVVQSPYVKTPSYYGPHKRYEYWFTGKNKEVLNYEHSVENAFFNVTNNPDGTPASQGGTAKIPSVPSKRTSEDRQGRIGDGMESQNSTITTLFDPGSWAKAKITILGDPDYLVREGADSINDVYNQFYGSDGFTINPNGGQVFIEIVFKEGIDYSHDTGTMNINDQIYMWNYPPNMKNPPKGIQYMLVEIDHYFKGGKFTQTLDAKIAPFSNLYADESTPDRETPATTETASDVRTSDPNATPANTGFTQDNNQSNAEVARLTANNAVAQDMASNQFAAETQRLNNLNTAATQVVNTNNPATPATANDDSVQNTGATQAGSVTSTSADAGRETQADTLNERVAPNP